MSARQITPARWGRYPAAILAVLLTAAAITTASARAQGPVYPPTAPTPGGLYRDSQSGRYLLGGTWLYRADPSDAGVVQGWWRDAASTDGWSPVQVPDSFDANDLSAAAMSGSVGWYRRDFVLPPGAFASYVAARERHWIVRFQSVNYRATVWLNGRQIGQHAGAYLPWELDLSNLRAGVNRLVIRVDDRRTPTDFPPGPGGGWWNYGGLLGEVYLRAVQRVDISRVQVSPQLPCPSCAATVTEQVLVRNLTGVSEPIALRGSYGSARVSFTPTLLPAHGQATLLATVRIPHPKLWSPARPYLYRAGLVLSDIAGHRLQGYVTYSGVRSITRTSSGALELNGRVLHLRGVSIHLQALGRGAALGLAGMRRFIYWTQRLGGTLIRAHYPLPEAMEEMADRDGILLWSEVPVYQLSAQTLAQPAVVAQAEQLLETNILTNGNHPSILTWSIGNELPASATAGEASYVAGATALAHQLDPTRPVSLAISSYPGVPCQTAYLPLDLIGYNDYFGWFSAGGGGTDDRDSLGPFLDTLHACYPGQAMMVTEFGFDANRHGPVEERGTYEFQSDSAAYHLGVFASKPWLSGAVWFALQDFASRPGWSGGNPWGQPPYVQKGLIDLQGNPKPAFSVVQSIYQQTVQVAAARRRHRG